MHRCLKKEIYKDHEILITIFNNRWDAEKSMWRNERPTLSRKLKNIVKKTVNLPINENSKPNLEELRKFFFDNLNLTTNKKDGVSTINILTTNIRACTSDKIFVYNIIKFSSIIKNLTANIRASISG